MNKQTAFLRGLCANAAALCLILGLQACGGGQTALSQQTPNGDAVPVAGVQFTSGVVTGFGSVFVDGVEIEDADALVVKENHDGSFTKMALQMGHHVRVSRDAKGAASQIVLDAAVIGKVTAVDANAKNLTVAGQQVKVIDDASLGVLTTWGGGYSGLSDVVSDDLVEVHGTPVYDANLQAYTVNATRVAKLTDVVGRVQFMGAVSSLNTDAKTFVVNGITVNYATAALRPRGAALADGLIVTVYGPASALISKSLTVDHLKINRIQNNGVALTQAEIGGQVSNFNSEARRFEVQGIPVIQTDLTVIKSANKTLKDGAYVKVRGGIDSDGILTAATIEVRTQDTASDLATVKLVGVISDLIDGTSFVVRGVPVDATGVTKGQSCANVTLANNVEVTITATQQANTPVVLANQMECRAGSMVVIRPIFGEVVDVRLQEKWLGLSRTNVADSDYVLGIRWNDATVFMGLTQEQLVPNPSLKLRIEGYRANNGEFIARLIMPGGGEPPRDRDGDRFRSDVQEGGATAWQRYRQQRGHH